MEIPEKNILSPLLHHSDYLNESADNCTRAVVQEKRRDSAQRQFEPQAFRRRAGDTHAMIEKVKVYIRVVFLKVGEINTLKEKYAADVFLQARWRQPGGYTMRSSDGKEEPWNPQIQIENVLGDSKEEEWAYTDKERDGGIRVFECQRIKGVFVENLELEHFPFDTQDLSLTISSELTEAEVELLEDEEELSSVNKQSFVDEQEWALYEHVEMLPRASVKEYTSSRERHPTILASCHAARRPGFFIWNIFLIMMLITLLAFATFAVSIEHTQNRLQLSFTLVLTGVAFKFVVNQSLPRISYLTYMDKYILSSMIYIVLVCVWHSVAGKLYELANKEFAQQLDWKALIFFVIIYISSHLLFSFWIYKVVWKRRRLMVKKDEAYCDKASRIIREESGAMSGLKRRRHSVWNPGVSMKKLFDSSA
ncbi:cys-loop ligand-gated ion channel-like [Gigantopelta aegis]|uniref:cys-loop ligand-gated ion channel-like n=1 Tax=Gigantopelta aegis TaxID=1735272 RepID=UPI001B887F4F|nr:cys-loop ligand-gated ion channel-like [Gigantopelta aegis]